MCFTNKNQQGVFQKFCVGTSTSFPELLTFFYTDGTPSIHQKSGRISWNEVVFTSNLFQETNIWFSQDKNYFIFDIS